MMAPLLWLTVLLTCGHGVARTSSAKRLNVLFLAADDLRYQLGCSSPGVAGPGCAATEGGKCTKMLTPNIDKLAGMSLLCHKNYVQQAVCSPTRTSLLTSRRPDTTRVWDLYNWFRTVGQHDTGPYGGGGNYTTIPELFKSHGYYTQGQGKIFHPGHASGGGSGKKYSANDDLPFSWSYNSSGAAQYWHSPEEPYKPDPYGGPHSWLSVNASAEKAHAAGAEDDLPPAVAPQ